jgi:hypothetical protein
MWGNMRLSAILGKTEIGLSMLNCLNKFPSAAGVNRKTGTGSFVKLLLLSAIPGYLRGIMMR